MHGTEHEVFDDTEFNLLKHFTGKMSVQTCDAILQGTKMGGQAGSWAGMKVTTQCGSLAGHLIALSGTDDPAFDDRDWEFLRTGLRGVCPRRNKLGDKGSQR
ncbi:hypothetical protein LTR84_011940 [Exophiala bonariae]|uniref:Uncharacterized protein n=1 Tax=Exophiala bonariae TaxID=1690606 RepID=A0AAV9MU74_9EURO|nr:hypothetical protein LTR84_011940 [Exophiala bonariae]